MIILGIDPGTTRLGFGLIEKKGNSYTCLEYGLLVPEKTLIESKLSDKLLLIHNSLKNLLKRSNADLLGLEDLFFSKNVKTALPVSMVRGVIMLTGAQHNITIIEPTPNQVKQGVTGSANADKTQVTKMVTSLLGLKAPPKPDDVADALAIAITVANINMTLYHLK